MSLSAAKLSPRRVRVWQWRNAKSQILHWLASRADLWPDAPVYRLDGGLMDTQTERPENRLEFKLLLVVAHPDDESESAAVVYRITHELGGTVDLALITNGEGGFRYVAPAQAHYGLPLAHQGAKHLLRVRRREALQAGRILGIRNTYFFDQRDTGFTFDAWDGFTAWDVAGIRRALADLIEQEEYDGILTLLPSVDTHGHHKTAAILVCEVAVQFHFDRRPVVLAVQTTSPEDPMPNSFDGLPDFSITRTVSPQPIWRFDRKTPLHGHSELDYSILANWVIAEHKSQGMFQMEFGRKRFESYWLFRISDREESSRWHKFQDLIDRLEPADRLSPRPSSLGRKSL